MSATGGVFAQLARFATVGGVATLVHLAVAWLAHRAGFSPLQANGAGFAVAFAVSYLGHFHWTFGRPGHHARHLPRFVVLSAMGYALTNLIVWAVTLTAGARFEASLAVILLVVPVFTWAAGRFWAFRPDAEG